ncbi:hypothetical protein RclHR1_09060020 [Rhizophagus clarus]|uniref:Uncharacterized protein n=2 Tax=Rhizophagus clarus TaxID=94130 RepID=A0A2Z6S9A1_9GLOM|nr:hypothetical protein RclHR1_09060020 [Rhizophagus clarus]GES73960.1 hypothetical protein RCL_jg4370.t1 [Rhizophagus clarus]
MSRNNTSTHGQGSNDRNIVEANLDNRLTQNQKEVLTQNCIDVQKVYYSERGPSHPVPVNSNTFEFQLNQERSGAFFKPVVSDSNEPHMSFQLSGTADRSQSPLSYFNDVNTQVTGGHVTLHNENEGKDKKVSTSLSEAADFLTLLHTGESIGMRPYNNDALHAISWKTYKLVEQGLKDLNDDN